MPFKDSMIRESMGGRKGTAALDGGFAERSRKRPEPGLAAWRVKKKDVDPNLYVRNSFSWAL